MAVANHHHLSIEMSTSPALIPVKSSTIDVDSEYMANCIANTRPMSPLLPVVLRRRYTAPSISIAGPVRSWRLESLLLVEEALASTGGAGGGGGTDTAASPTPTTADVAATVLADAALGSSPS